MSLYLVEVVETYITRYVVDTSSVSSAEQIAENHNIDDAGADGQLIGCDRQSVVVNEVPSTTWSPVLTGSKEEGESS